MGTHQRYQMFALLSHGRYYGVVTCMGVKTLVSTLTFHECGLYPEAEAQEYKKYLLTKNIAVHVVPYLAAQFEYNKRLRSSAKFAASQMAGRTLQPKAARRKVPF